MIGRIPNGPEVIFMDCTIGGELPDGVRIPARGYGPGIGSFVCQSIYAPTHAISPIPEHWSMSDADPY